MAQTGLSEKEFITIIQKTSSLTLLCLNNHVSIIYFTLKGVGPSTFKWVHPSLIAVVYLLKMVVQQPVEQQPLLSAPVIHGAGCGRQPL